MLGVMDWKLEMNHGTARLIGEDQKMPKLAMT